MKNLFYVFDLSCALILLASPLVRADEVTNIPEVGVHQKILIVEKSVHPQNILVVYSKLDQKCNFVFNSPSRPVFDFYWLQNGTSYKPMNSTLRAEVEKRMEIQPEIGPAKAKMFYVSLNDLKLINHDIPDPRLMVTALIQGRTCRTQSLMRLGPSDQNAVIQVDSFYGESVGYFNPKIMSVTLKGTNIHTGAPVTRTYKAK